LINSRAKLDLRDKYDQTPLIDASYLNRISIVEQLVSAGCLLDLQDTFGESALHKVSWLGFPEIADILLENGANPNL